MTSYEIFSLIAQYILAAGAIIFGIAQTKINHRIKQLQDYVALTVTVELVDGIKTICITNSGKINVYLYRYELANIVNTMERGALIGVDNSATHYNIHVNNLDIFTVDREYTLKLYVKDSAGRRYLSEHSVERKSNEKLVVKSFAPFKERWNY